MRATNAKADHGSSGDYCDALNLCITLEQELAECRLRLAMELCHVASEAENYGNAEAAANYRATAAHLRDLSQPLDPSKL